MKFFVKIILVLFLYSITPISVAQYPLNFTNGYLSPGMMTCTDKGSYVQKPNGEKISMNVNGSKPWLLTSNNNILYSYYSGVQPPVYTVANGAKFIKAQVEPDGKGGQVRSFIFENIQSDGSRNRISIYDLNPTGVMMESYGGGSPNIAVSVSQCRY